MPRVFSVAVALALLCLSDVQGEAGAFGSKQGDFRPLLDTPSPMVGDEHELVSQLRQDLAAAQRVLKSNGLPVIADAEPLPQISMFTVFATTHYPLYLNVTLESMRLNAPVQFNIVNIVDDESDLGTLQRQLLSPISNVHIHALTLKQFIARVTDKLGIEPDIPSARHLVLKAHDYKPSFAVLWGDYIAEQKAEYWGWHDLDEVLGSFANFAHIFNKHQIISGCDGRSCGPFMLFEKGGFDQVFQSCPDYLVKLAALKNDMLDEEGCCGGPYEDHATYMIHTGWKKHHGTPPKSVYMAMLQNEFGWSGGRVGTSGFKYADQYIHAPTGLSMWRDGEIHILADHDRELLMFHRPSSSSDTMGHLRPSAWTDPEDLQLTLARMVANGFLLPSFVPLQWWAEGFGTERAVFTGGFKARGLTTFHGVDEPPDRIGKPFQPWKKPF
jgi:hypothetical protein